VRMDGYTIFSLGCSGALHCDMPQSNEALTDKAARSTYTFSIAIYLPLSSPPIDHLHLIFSLCTDTNIVHLNGTPHSVLALDFLAGLKVCIFRKCLQQNDLACCRRYLDY